MKIEEKLSNRVPCFVLGWFYVFWQHPCRSGYSLFFFVIPMSKWIYSLFSFVIPMLKWIFPRIIFRHTYVEVDIFIRNKMHKMKWIFQSKLSKYPSFHNSSLYPRRSGYNLFFFRHTYVEVDKYPFFFRYTYVEVDI